MEQNTFATRFDGVTGSAIREILKLLTNPGMISFGGGNPAPETLDADVISDIAQDVLKKDGKNILQYGASEGYGPLREQLLSYLPHFGFTPSDAEILPITGSTQGGDLVFKALIDPGDVILVEDPTFMGMTQAMRLYQAQLIPVPTDEQGIIPEELVALVETFGPKMLYVIPTFQNPTGRSLSLDRRKILAELARQFSFFILEDDPYRDLRYSGEEMPAIKAFDSEGWVIHLSSFSKLISPGLRLGTVCAHPEILRKLVIGKQATDVHTSGLTQAIVAEYLRRGLLPEHLADIQQRYGDQLRLMMEHLSRFPQGTTYTQPNGGLFIWATLPEGIDAMALMNEAVARGVAYVPGQQFFITPGHERTMRLNFSNSTPEQIDRGMEILRALVMERV